MPLIYRESIECIPLNKYSLELHVYKYRWIHTYIYWENILSEITLPDGKICEKRLNQKISYAETFPQHQLKEWLFVAGGADKVSPCSDALSIECGISHPQWHYWVLICYTFPELFNVGL